MATRGYPTDGQTLEAQQTALIAAGAERVFAGRLGCVAAPEPGDGLLVTKLDGLARSTRDLLNTLDAIGTERSPPHLGG